MDNYFKQFKDLVDKIWEEKILPLKRDSIIDSDDITDLRINIGLYGDDIDSFIKNTKPVIK